MPSVGALTAAKALWFLALPGGIEGVASRADRLPQCSWSAWGGAAGTQGTVDTQGHTVPWFALSQQSSPQELTQVNSQSPQP